MSSTPVKWWTPTATTATCCPTIILQKGTGRDAERDQHLPDLTTTHWHGLHVSAANDGGPHSLIYPNTTWSPSFTVLDRASTFWYHPHGHGLTDFGEHGCGGHDHRARCARSRPRSTPCIWCG
ncbi:MAG: multicopper oxidase domain-containing protein [Flavobacteriales bacterium]|nr:multicopper oxidase domain-containing protein [Flavobacteriales bacterium]